MPVARLGPADVDRALAVYRAANAARGRAPSPQRLRRVREKLVAADALAVVAAGTDGVSAGMALGEPGRADDGRGPVEPELLHVSMVFVAPDRQGEGIGSRLLAGLFDEARAAGYTRASLWTGRANHAALSLYARAGLRPSGRTAEIPDVGAAVHLASELPCP